MAKVFGWRHPSHRFFSRFMRSKGEYALEAALHLEQHGLGTPSPVGAAWLREGGAVGFTCYVCRDLGEGPDVRILLRGGGLTVEERRKILEALAAYVRRMHDTGMVHNDLTLANFLVREGRLYLIDLNRARVRRHALGLWERVRDLARMDLTPEEMGLFLKLYKMGGLFPGLVRLKAAQTNWGRALRRLRKALRKAKQG